MKITLRVLDGSLAGKDHPFDMHEGADVRIGRDPGRCDMVMPVDYGTVSRQHCTLRAVLGRIRLRVNKENPVLVGGKDGWDDSLVRSGSELQLGRGGPRLLLTIAEEADAIGVKPTYQEGAKQHVPPEELLQEQAESTRTELRKHRKSVVLAGVGITISVGVGLYFALDARAQAGSLVAASLTPEQRRSLAELADNANRPKADFGAVVRTAEPSVYCVITQSGSLSEHVGTAWVLDKQNGLVATNAHVAKEFLEGKTFLRTQGKAKADIPVERVTIHAGYQRYTDLCQQYKETLKVSSGASMIAACDVALLHIATANRSQLSLALPLAPKTELEALSAGDNCATVGYPAEGIAFNVELPTARAHFGHVIANSDFFMAPAGAGQAELIHTDLPVTGGASGSPVLTAGGKVVGIINAGSFALGMQGRRIPIAGTTYAQRVDLLSELIQNDEPKQQARIKGWDDNFKTMARNAQRSIEQVLLEQFQESISGDRNAESVEVLVRKQERLLWDGELAHATMEYQLPTDGSYMFFALASDSANIDAVAIFPNGHREVDIEDDWYPCVIFSGKAGQAIKFVVFRELKETADVSILVARARE